MPLYFKLSWFGLDIMVHLISFHISSKWSFLMVGWILGWNYTKLTMNIRFNYESFNDLKIMLLLNSYHNFSIYFLGLAYAEIYNLQLLRKKSK